MSRRALYKLKEFPRIYRELSKIISNFVHNVKTSYMNRYFLLFGFFLASSISMVAQGVLAKNTVIPIVLNSSISSDSHSNPVVRVATDIKGTNGNVLIQAGSPVVVSYNATPARTLGRPGKVTMNFVSTLATDGTVINLTGNEIEVTGKNISRKVKGIGIGIGVAIYWPIFFYLFKKGGEATLNSGQLYTDFVTMSEYKIK